MIYKINKISSLVRSMGFIHLTDTTLRHHPCLKPRGSSLKTFLLEFHDFLVTNYNGYTVASGNISGHWTDGTGRDHYGEHREYKVAISNQESLHCLEVFVAHMALEMCEQCIYFEMAGEIRLLYGQPI